MQYITPKGCRLSRMNNDIFEIETKFQLTLTLTLPETLSVAIILRLLSVLLEIALLVYFVT